MKIFIKYLRNSSSIINYAFRTQGGVHIHDDQVTVTAPTIMWVKVRLCPMFSA